MTIRVPNAGDAPLAGKGQRGDLLVRVTVSNSKLFRRQGTNLYHEVRIPLHTALLGGRVRVPTLDGEVDVRVPGGTQPGEEMVLKGRGIKDVFKSGKGDLFVTFSVQIPRQVYWYYFVIRFRLIVHSGHCLSDNGKFFSSMLMTSKGARPRQLARASLQTQRVLGRILQTRMTKILMVRHLPLILRPRPHTVVVGHRVLGID
jgi:DnaJ-class molecular chaperone